jgi:hypothetical protein
MNEILILVMFISSVENCLQTPYCLEYIETALRLFGSNIDRATRNITVNTDIHAYKIQVPRKTDT